MGGGNSCSLDSYKPVVAMVVVQFIYAAMALSAKAAFREGMNTMVFVVYRQAIATLVLAPSTLLAKGGNFRQMGLSMRAFGMVFVAALVGATLNQYFYYQGLDLASSSMATAMTNLIPAITFVMAASIGFEKVTWSVRSAAKVVGTLICVGGATCMAFYKGPRLLNVTSFLLGSSTVTSNWVAGGLFLMTSTCCWSFWLILQGVFGSGVTFYLQSWSISVRGPLFSALFNPLSTVITTIFDALVLREKLYVGSIVGAGAVMVGLYVVLWGKAVDVDLSSKSQRPRLDHDPDGVINVAVSVDEKTNDSQNDATKPLLGRVIEDV